MDIFIVCAIAICVLLLALPLRQMKGEYAIILSLVTSVIILKYAFDGLKPIIDSLKNLFSNEYGDCFKITLKVLAITIITHMTSDLCRDFGESSLAGKVELAGKAAIIISAFPLFSKLIGFVDLLLEK